MVTTPSGSRTRTPQAVGELCKNDLTCYGTVRRDDFNGTDPSSFSDVAPDQSIAARLADLLSYLASKYPSEGWVTLSGWRKGQLGHDRGGRPLSRWWRCRIHRQGREDRGRRHAVLGGRLDDHVAAGGCHLPDNRAPTPLSRYVGFDHTGDPFYPKIRTDWTALGLDELGPATSVDHQSAPYAGSHQLITSVAVPPEILATHDSTAVDSATPMCPDGTPEFAPVWRYMMQVAGGLPIVGGSAKDRSGPCNVSDRG